MDVRSLNWYISQFPESQFVCVSNADEYKQRVIHGHTIASKSNVLICGIARNVAKNLHYTIARIERLRSYFNNSHVYIYENDSEDNTLDILNKTSYTIESERHDISIFDDPKGLMRKIWMAFARNKYIEYASKFCLSNRIHYVIILDTDLSGGWSYHGILNSLSYDDWDVVGSNSILYQIENDRYMRLFYDSWAFREYGNFEEINDSRANLFRFERGDSLIQVYSCFGGLAIYKPHFLYSGASYNSEDCDHVTLHSQLINLGYKIYLNPSQITLYNNTVYNI